MITHINKTLAQQIVDTIKDLCGQDINFIDDMGIIFASTNPKRIGDFHEIGKKAADTGDTIEVCEDNSFYGTQKGVNIPIFHNGDTIAIIGITGEPEQIRNYAYLAVKIVKILIREQELDAYNHSQKEKKNYIIRALIHGETVNREYLLECLSEISIDTKDSLRVVIIELNARYNIVNLSMIEQKVFQLFNQIKTSLFTYNYPNQYIAITADTAFTPYASLLEKFAEENKEIIKIGIGSSQSLYQLSKSYHNGLIAIKSCYNIDNYYAVFDNLDLSMILSCIDKNVHEDYLQKTISKLTKEELSLLNTYYKHDMSLSKTCSELYLHKNSLQYKLDRIYRISGYNPRNFKDAVILYIALKLCNLPL